MCVYERADSRMPPRTIYLPDDLDLALRQFPGEINLSRICAKAVRTYIDAQNTQRTEGPFPQLLREMSVREMELCELSETLRCAYLAYSVDPERRRESIGFYAAAFLEESLMEGQELAIGGGKQMWEMARRLERRNVGTTIWALGFGDVDREAPHLHPNALATLLGMRYGSRSSPKLVGTKAGFREAWEYPALHPNIRRDVQRVIIGSCSMFDPDSHYARVLGKEMTDFLMEEHVMGDFLGVFITPDGRIVTPYAPSMTASFIPGADLQELAKREDTLVILAAGGEHKLKLIWQLLELNLCNVLITDEFTAEALQRYREQLYPEPVDPQSSAAT